MTLSEDSPVRYRYVCSDGIFGFRRFAVKVQDVQQNGKTDKQIAAKELSCMEKWMNELRLILVYNRAAFRYSRGVVRYCFLKILAK